MKWLSLGWWRYLWEAKDWTQLFCRMRGHPGPVWFNPGGVEPDMHCKRCGEYLG